LAAIHLPDNFNPSAADEAAMGRDIDALNEEMIAAGVRIFAGGLRPASSAKSLRAQPGGKVLITDGRYLETKEHIGGLRTDLILAGRMKAQTDETIAAAVDKKELPAMEPGAMCFMMSKQGYGGDSIAHWPSHLMFYFSQTDPATWGANLPGSPIFASTDTSEHLTEFVVAAQRWSDGTEGR